MEGGSPLGTHHNKDRDFNLREWHLRARISRENTSSRRFSASYIRSFREDSAAPFKSNFTVSSTTSSPGCNLKDEIDPSTYSFTAALKALQAKSGYVWECVSPEVGFALNSKWNEAERFICNPLSGEVPLECLSAKTLSARSFRNNMTSRVTMSAPLVFSVQPRRTCTTSNSMPPSNNMSTPLVIKEQLVKLPSLKQQEEKKIMGTKTRDVGIQSTPPEGSSSSPSPASTPSIKERSINRCEESRETEDGDTQNSSSSIKFNPVDEKQECTMQVEVKVTSDGEKTKGRSKEHDEKKKKKTGQSCFCKHINGGCLPLSSWNNFWVNKRRERKIHAPDN